MFVALGTLAEERGRDSAGVALRGRGPGTGRSGWRVVTGRGGFSEVWRPGLLADLDAAPVALGHTRWATQGTTLDPANASPLVVPGSAAAFAHGEPVPAAGVVATHNGDIDAAALRERFATPPATGTTDSEPVFQLLAGCRDTADVTAVLSAVVGRAALAWVDRDRPCEVHLARASLSPLTVAVDMEQNFYWGSNPRWFRDIERHTRVRFATAVMLREGTYLRIGTGEPGASGGLSRPRILDRAAFVPTARASDFDDRVWTGFTPMDEARDRAGLFHNTLEAPATGGDGEFATCA
ncbi:class II glutamine amidotransferase [Actinomadura fibrosa]|uniref:Glutamine amidotransferase type-2 domain-containing protein n=1 Tax=Actinomadura fibrosa TaxID=111802 RepID=A0ABW2XZV6_9ACTN|nr:hypothetical protein [Actinomadura fibrosa]